MEKLIIEGIHNKNDDYKNKLTNETKNIIGEFLKEHEAELKDQDINFLMNMEFINKLGTLQFLYFSNLLVDLLPQHLIQQFFNGILNYPEYAKRDVVLCSSVVIDKLLLESDTKSNLCIANSDIGTLECKFYQEKPLKDFLTDCVDLNIQRLILDEHFSLDKDYIEKLLSINISSVKEIIFKK